MVVRLRPTMDPSTFSVLSGYRLVSQFAGDPLVGVYVPRPGVTISDEINRARNFSGVDWVVQNKITTRKKHFVPNDPYYGPFVIGATSWFGQWHLNNTASPGRDINIVPAWNANWTGAGVIAAVCDDCIEPTHEDIAPNYDATDSWNYETLNNNPAPGYAADGHGASTSGLLAARGGNNLGGTGVAPLASLAGIRFNFNGGVGGSDADFAAGVSYHSAGGNTNIKVKSHSYGIGWPYVNDSLSLAELENSGAAGTIHIWSAGNERGYAGEDSIKQEVHNSQYGIQVAALGSNGKFADYSCFGSDVMCTIPSSSSGLLGILTTDRSGADGYNDGTGAFNNGNYCDDFGGTSASAPICAGVATVVKQAQPALNARFLKHLLVRTSKQVDATDTTTTSDGGWRTNGGGYKFNQNYGFGLIDASALVTQAQLYSGVTAQTTTDSGTITVGAAIPDNAPTGVTRTTTVSGQTQPIETISLTLNATHSWQGDLSCYVTSPSGFKVRLFSYNGADSDPDIAWTFTTNAFWGESANGTWTIQIADNAAVDTGTWTNYRLVTRGGALVPATKTVSGSVNLVSRVAASSNLPTTVQVFAVGNTTTPLRTYNVTPSAGGAYSFSTDLSAGNYDITFKSRPFLQTRVSNVAIGSTGASGVNPTCLGGDIDNNNTINLNDFSKLSGYYGLNSSAANWLTVDGQGVRPVDCDITGDGTVGLNDFSVLSSNYGLSGSN